MVEMSEKQSGIFEAARNVLETLLDLMEIPASVMPSPEFTAEDEDDD